MNRTTVTQRCFFTESIIIICTAFFSVQPAKAQQQIDWGKVHASTVEAMNELYNLRFPEAEAKCNEVITLAKSDPRGYFFKAMTYYYWHKFDKNGNAGKARYAQFLSSVNNVLTICDNILENNEHDAKAKFYKGGILGYRGLMQYFEEKKVLNAAWDAKKALSLLNDAHQDDPTNTDVQFGLGLFNYLIAQAPNSIRPILSKVGISGNSAEGLRLLEAAAAKGVYSRAEARLWLADFYPEYYQYKKRGSAHLKILCDQYPQSWYLRERYAGYQLSVMFAANDANISYQKLEVLATTSPRFQSKNEILVRSSRGKGLCAYFLNKYSDCISAMQDVIQSPSASANNKQEAQYYIGMSHELSDNHDKALEFLSKLPKSYNTESILKAPMSANDKEIQRASNCLRSGDFKDAISRADVIITSATATNDNRAYMHYIAGRAYTEIGNSAKAEERYWNAIQLNPPSETWLVPFSYWRMGISLQRQNKQQQAKGNFENALRYSQYNNESFLRQQVQQELDMID